MRILTRFSQTKSNDSDVSAQKWDSRKSSVYGFFNVNQYGIIATQECEYRQKAEILANAPGYAAFGRGSEYGEDSGGSVLWQPTGSSTCSMRTWTIPPMQSEASSCMLSGR